MDLGSKPYVYKYKLVVKNVKIILRNINIKTHLYA